MQWIDQQSAEAKLDQRVEKSLKTMVAELPCQFRGNRDSAGHGLSLRDES
jgi:hypothetical protein